MAKEIKLTLYPDEIRIGTVVKLENGKVYEVCSVEEERGDITVVISESQGDPTMSVTFGDEVRSYGKLYTVSGVNTHSWGNPRIKLKRLNGA